MSSDLINAFSVICILVIGLNLSEIIKESTIDNVLANGMNSISLFNSKKVVYADSDGNINSQDVRLAYFYHNRLIGYNLEEYL